MTLFEEAMTIFPKIFLEMLFASIQSALDYSPVELD